MIPAGATLGMLVYVLHHDSKYWPDPLTFDPDRFLPQEVAKRHPYSYLPFAGGPRNCVGKYFIFFFVPEVLIVSGNSLP